MPVPAINLLPWRTQAREHRRNQFFIMLFLGVLLGFVVIALWIMVLDYRLEEQQTRNQFLQDRIAELSTAQREIEVLRDTKAQLLSRYQVIQRLQARRPDMVRLFDETVQLIPANLYLNDMVVSDERITLRGMAQNNRAVSELMRRLEESPEYGESKLQVINTAQINQVRVKQFSLIAEHQGPKLRAGSLTTEDLLEVGSGFSERSP